MKSLEVKAKNMGFKKAIACWFYCMVFPSSCFAGDPAVTNMQASITVADGRTPTTGDYMVIDLSGGTGASSYPVTYLTAVPSGGWTDEYKTDKLVMRKIPSGTFMMGYRATDYPGATDSGLRSVTLTKDFYIGVFEVTQRQWELVMGNKPSYFNNATYYASRPVECVKYCDIRDNSYNALDTLVGWPTNSAVNETSFIGNLRTKTGLSTLDLPTESQWEYACRAGTTTALNTGYDLTKIEKDFRMGEAGRYSGNNGYWHRERYQAALNAVVFWRKGSKGVSHSKNDGIKMTTALAGSYLPNDWDLYDMHGNVYEWCFNQEDTYLGTVTEPLDSSSGFRRVLRGGCWASSAEACLSSHRLIYTHHNLSNRCIGFRIARTLP